MPVSPQNGVIATVPMQARHQARRQSVWDDAGENIIEHLAGLEDFEAAEATYRAAVKKPVIMRDRQGGG
jgi:hypothetical protein